MCEVRSKEKIAKNKPPPPKSTMIKSKKMDCDEFHLMSNEKMQPIQWTKQPTSALVVASSLWLGFMAFGLVV